MKNIVNNSTAQSGIKNNSIIENQNQIEQLAYIINSVDGKEPPAKAKRLIHQYMIGDIDYETAEFEIKKMYLK